jgi:hypothetical protein
VEIGTNSRVLATPSMVQLVTKLVSPLKGGTRLEIIPLHVQTFTIHAPVTGYGVAGQQPNYGHWVWKLGCLV